MENGWREFERVLGELVEMPSGQWEVFLDRAGLTTEVRRRVEELLTAWRESDGFLEPPVLAAPPQPDRLIGQRLGPWRVVSIIGSGGMGAVYRATREDAEFAQEAALKVVAAGRMSASSERRFREERRILARLEHPY